MKLLFVLAVCLWGAVVPVFGEDPMTVSLYYESYCPDCIKYMEENIIDAWRLFKDEIFMDLVPFGNAKQSYVDGHFKFECQHGPKECLANKLHACAIFQACGEGGTAACPSLKVGHVIKFIYCDVHERDQLEGAIKCAKAENLDPEDIIKCAHNDRGDLLLSKYGNRTAAFQPNIEYVPTVALDGVHDKLAEDNLVAEICRMRPDMCTDVFIGPEAIQV